MRAVAAESDRQEPASLGAVPPGGLAEGCLTEADTGQPCVPSPSPASQSPRTLEVADPWTSSPGPEPKPGVAQANEQSDCPGRLTLTEVRGPSCVHPAVKLVSSSTQCHFQKNQAFYMMRYTSELTDTL